MSVMEFHDIPVYPSYEALRSESFNRYFMVIESKPMRFDGI